MNMAKAMPGNKKVRRKSRQVNQYDKILKENIEAALPGLIRNLLNIHAVNTEELPDEIQHTKERKPDVLKRVTDEKENTFVLHIEFQVKDEPKMVFRMAEYHIMLLRKYELPVLQYVIYIGAGNPNMTDHIRSEPMTFKYSLIALAMIDYHLLLRSDKPEEKMLAILADLGRGNPKRTIENIVTQVVASSKGNFSKLRHVQQLRILAQLRNLASDNLEIMDSVANYMSEEKDIFYRRGEKKGLEKGIEKGIAKGVEKGKVAFVKNLLLQTDFSIAKIAALSDVTEAFVKKVKKTLK
jgi:predicted transposase/invertase (TIGR01784 family)